MSDFAVEEIDFRALGDEALAELHAFGETLREEARPEDPPVPLDQHVKSARNLPSYLDFREFQARDDGGALIGEGWALNAVTDDNPHLVQVAISVLPRARRRGVGRELLRNCVGAAEAAGRSLVMGSTSDRVSAGEAFARRVGATIGIRTHLNRLVLADVDRGLVARWIEEAPARAPGYSLLAVDGSLPEDILGPFVELMDVMNTAPRDDLEVHDEHATPERVRENDSSLEARGVERWTLFTRHDATGELVGYTQVFYNPRQPQTVGQGDTGVRPEHRGHALGKWLKAAMLERILRERTDAADVRTGNADSNAPMLGINHALGFKPFIASIGWQVPLARLKEYLGG